MAYGSPLGAILDGSMACSVMAMTGVRDIPTCLQAIRMAKSPYFTEEITAENYCEIVVEAVKLVQVEIERQAMKEGD